MPDPTDRPGPRALVAEDDVDLRALVVDALRREGFVVHGVEDGRHLWRCTFEAQVYDLIVADLRLPVVDGLTVLEDFHGRVPQAQLVVMTAFPDQGARARAARLGAVLLEKPFEMDALRAAVRRLPEPAAHGGRS